MKYIEINSLTIEELKQRIEAEQENLRKFRFAHAISPIENPMKIKNTRRFIAKLETAKSVSIKKQSKP